MVSLTSQCLQRTAATYGDVFKDDLPPHFFVFYQAKRGVGWQALKKRRKRGSRMFPGFVFRDDVAGDTWRKSVDYCSREILALIAVLDIVIVIVLRRRWRP